MAERQVEPDTPELRARWGAFAWTAENTAKAKEIVAREPDQFGRSARSLPQARDGRDHMLPGAVNVMFGERDA